jgi:anthranilate phosphoribosyltransferase
MKEILELLVQKKNLSPEQMQSVFGRLMNGELEDAQTAGFLMGLECKGITADELSAAARVMRAKVIRVPISVDAIDTCGTGGDGKPTFNVSTAAAIIAAGSGAYVAKHGNRTNTRKSGSAEAFAALGVNINADVQTVARCIEKAHIGFCYAVKLHPAMKFAAPVRKSLAIRTIFNLLGPMTNPAGVKRQIIGVAKEELAEKLAKAMLLLGTEHAMIIHAKEGLCDISISGQTIIFEIVGGTIRSYTINPSDFGISSSSLSEITITSPEESAEVIRNILKGKKSPARDIASLNAAAALVVAGLADDISDGLVRAYDSIDSGRAMATLNALVEMSHQ